MVRASAVPTVPWFRTVLIFAAASVVGVLDARQLEILLPVWLFFEQRRGAVTNLHPAGGLVLADPRLFHVAQIFAFGDRALAEGSVFYGLEERCLAAGLDSGAYQVSHDCSYFNSPTG